MMKWLMKFFSEPLDESYEYHCELVSRDTYHAFDVGDQYGPEQKRVVCGFYDYERDRFLLVLRDA